MTDPLIPKPTPREGGQPSPDDLQALVEKLDELKAKATKGPWRQDETTIHDERIDAKNIANCGGLQHRLGPGRHITAKYEEYTANASYIVALENAYDKLRSYIVAVGAAAQPSELVELLRQLEWSDFDSGEDGETSHVCPWCSGSQERGHFGGCGLARAISIASQPHPQPSNPSVRSVPGEEAIRAALKPFAQVANYIKGRNDLPDEQVVCIQCDVSRDVVVGMQEDWDRQKTEGKEPPYLRPSEMNWPKEVLALDSVTVGDFRRARAVLDLFTGTPEGMKLVPVEPTEEMLAAGQGHACYQVYVGKPSAQSLTDAYRAMLAAAPAPSPANDGGWRTIESAPLDGTPIETRYVSDDPKLVRWSHSRHGTGWHLVKTPVATMLNYVPTHWRYAPEPPRQMLDEEAGRK